MLLFMKKYNMITPEGTRDLLFEECKARRQVESELSKLFVSIGYCEVVTPTLEFFDVFSKQINQEKMYKVTDSKGRLMVLRPDLTTPVARITATRLKSAVLPIRLYYNQNVYRVNQSMRGRSDEVAQSGVELIGASGIKADLEIIVTAINALSKCAVSDYRFELGDVGFFKALMSDLPISDDEKEDIRVFIESKNYASLNDLIEKLDGCNENAKAIGKLPQLFGGDEVFEEAMNLAYNDEAKKTLEYLKNIYHELVKMGYGEKITVDLGLVQKIDYYTGLVFRGYIEWSGEPVLTGGRYDTLPSEFGMDTSATGFAVNVDAVANARLIAGKKPQRDIPDTIIFYEYDFLGTAFSYLNALTSKGLCCELSVFDTVAETIDYAKSKGITRIDIVGESIETKIIGGAK